MPSLLSLFVVAASFACALALVSNGVQTLDYQTFDDSNKDQFVFVRHAVNPPPGYLLLTRNQGSQSGSVYLKDTVSLSGEDGFKASFSAFFQLQMDSPGGFGDEDGLGADGIVFVINSISNKDGSVGGGIGYQGLLKSVGIEFDTYNNGAPTDISGNHIGIDINGDMISKVSRHYDSRLNSDFHYVWVDFNGDSKSLEVRIQTVTSQKAPAVRPDDAFISYTVDLAAILETPNVYLGFSASTGGAWETHRVNLFQFTNRYAPIIPASTAVCGNNKVEDGEVCDGGDCCENCEFKSSSTVCRASAGVCDAAETCSGTSSSCPADGFKPSSEVCRAKANDCDVAESCSGSSASCPADKLSDTPLCFCKRQSTKAKPFPDYFCVNSTTFYQCVYEDWAPQSALMNCGAGTRCGCKTAECGCGGNRSPCIMAADSDLPACA